MNVSIQPSSIQSAEPTRAMIGAGVIRLSELLDADVDRAYAVSEVYLAMIETWTPRAPRQFKSGEVRIVGTRFNGRVGYLFEDNGNEEEDRPYRVALYGDETDENFSASELIPWVPKVGDWVAELHSQADEVGIILANDGATSHVQWRTLKDAPYWPNIRLEPANEMPT
jgi:hypothetical protein